MTFFLLILLEIYVFKFAAFASVNRSLFEATSTAFLNGIDLDCRYYYYFQHPTFAKLNFLWWLL
jgi:hypothetical protein